MQEAQKWGFDLRVVRVIGSAKERERALEMDADIYVINRENIPWLVDKYERAWPFDMLVLDELSSFKNAKAQRFRALRRVMHRVDRVIGLTGTPAPNGLLDLWPQMYLIDGGERLGKFIGRYRDTYFSSYMIGTADGHQFAKYTIRPGAEEAIYRRIADICISMKAVDHIKMPERVDNFIELEMPTESAKIYTEMERDMVVNLFSGDTIDAPSAAAVAGKLLQMANGAVYDADGQWHPLHNAKLDALGEIIESAQGQGVLVYYGYKFDLQRILERFPQARVLKGDRDVQDWNAGRVEVLLAHPDSAGHGLNLQAGGHILVWYGLTWSLEKYQQACARLYRQGQKHSVIVHHLVCKGTIDEDVIQSLRKKETGQEALLKALKARL